MKILHNLLKGISLTGALFVFQACYGMPRGERLDQWGDAPMSFSLVSAKDGTPLEGVHIWSSLEGFGEHVAGFELGVTDAEGKCSVQIPFLRNEGAPYLRFEDEDGLYYRKDTSITDLREREIVIKMKSKF